MLKIRFFLFVIGLFGSGFSQGQCDSRSVPGGTIYQVTLRSSDFNLDHANYTIFIPEGTSPLRGIFIHQHGCTMEGIGEATGYDLQYQAFGRKWNFAILGPDLFPRANSGCKDWINPEDGSGQALLNGLDSLARCTQRSELRHIPWILWGHSGGGYWVLALTKNFPERTIAAFVYSPAFDPEFDFPPAVTKIPIMIRHAGANDFNSPGVNCWGTALHTFSKLNRMGGLVSIAFTANQNHNMSFVRYMAIPFFESVLSQRLPSSGLSELRNMDPDKAWLGDTTTTQTVKVYKSSRFKGNFVAMSWLPDSLCAVRYQEYVTTGTVRDVTKPSPVETLTVRGVDRRSVELSWTADADIESGIKYFNIYRNGRLLARYPEGSDFQSFSTNADNAIPLIPVAMTFRISGMSQSRADTFGVSIVNGFDLESQTKKVLWKAKHKK
jgi:hypothetical protein